MVAYVRSPVILPLRLARKSDGAEEVGEVEEAEEEEDEQLVWAEVYAPNRPDVDGEFMTPEDIKGIAHRFLIDGDIHRFDVRHNEEVNNQLFLVESFIARPGDPDFIPGSWVVGMYVDDDAVWAAIKRGELNGFSVQAMVFKTPTEVTVEIPDIVTGTTSEADGHTHTFAVKYDKEGNFLGGKTSFVNGHNHIIRAGTVTQQAKGKTDHTHRFSAVDNITVSEA